jgi:hypothetical protein
MKPLIFEPHRVSDRQSILDCFLKLANQQGQTASTLQPNLVYQVLYLYEFKREDLVQEFLQYARELQCIDHPHA